MLWDDIDWPDAGEPEGPLSFTHLLDLFCARCPEGVVNDRWGVTHWDFRTSEHQAGTALEGEAAWEDCRGIGLSFGYDRNEGPEHHLDGPAAVRHLVDVVSRGGNLLLDVGPDAAGRIPELQLRCLEGLAAWMAASSPSSPTGPPCPARPPAPSSWRSPSPLVGEVAGGAGAVDVGADAHLVVGGPGAS